MLDGGAVPSPRTNGTAQRNEAEPGCDGGDGRGEKRNLEAGHEGIAADGKIDPGDFVALHRDHAGLGPAEAGSTTRPEGDPPGQDD